MSIFWQIFLLMAFSVIVGGVITPTIIYYIISGLSWVGKKIFTKRNDSFKKDI